MCWFQVYSILIHQYPAGTMQSYSPIIDYFPYANEVVTMTWHFLLDLHVVGHQDRHAYILESILLFSFLSLK